MTEQSPQIYYLKQPIFKVLLSLLTVAVLYSNVAIIFGYMPFIKQPPVTPLANYLFNIYGVFSSYIDFGREYVLWAYTQDAETGDQQWERLTTNEYFPFKRCEQHSRMQVQMHLFNLPEKEYKKAQALMMAKVRAKYNREHSNKRVIKMILAEEQWPKSRREYEEFHTPEKTKTRRIYIEE